MTNEQIAVQEFHKAFDITINTKPTIPHLKDRELRRALIQEELDELSEAMLRGSITETADAIADLLYVVYGTAVSFGLDMEPIFNEVHRSNMTKIGGHKREDGKWVKPDTYEPAKLKSIIEGQRSSHWLLPLCSLCGSILSRWGWYENAQEPVLYTYCLPCDIAGKEPCIQIVLKEDALRVD